MIIKDTFLKFTKISKLSGCIAFFINEKLEITHLKKYLNSSDHKSLTVLLKNKSKNKKKGLLSFDLNPNQKIIPKLQFGNPIEDLSPLLSRKEFKENMLISTTKRSKKIFEAN